ncbi:hypothetical protein PSTEL_17740 [Paenibacillus stellifer]|uniref:Acyltransferase 3 domain-containing protein n=1 Tax=Paenibacillus stellifer TaxID=169760 RepID=A0A089LT05_9BACL|nr:hypothetical protein [Paenibacillus stellifer]AIQ64676.1 hypothetical protein PSTEL_17740 [Paenibacillus stellifer]
MKHQMTKGLIHFAQCIKTAAAARANHCPRLLYFGVILIHATSYATVQFEESRYFFFYNFLNIFMKFAVPAFLALNAFVLFYNYGGRRVTLQMTATFYKRRR